MGFGLAGTNAYFSAIDADETFTYSADCASISFCSCSGSSISLTLASYASMMSR